MQIGLQRYHQTVREYSKTLETPRRASGGQAGCSPEGKCRHHQGRSSQWVELHCVSVVKLDQRDTLTFLNFKSEIGQSPRPETLRLLFWMDETPAVVVMALPRVFILRQFHFLQCLRKFQPQDFQSKKRSDRHVDPSSPMRRFPANKSLAERGVSGRSFKSEQRFRNTSPVSLKMDASPETGCTVALRGWFRSTLVGRSRGPRLESQQDGSTTPGLGGRRGGFFCTLDHFGVGTRGRLTLVEGRRWTSGEL